MNRSGCPENAQQIAVIRGLSEGTTDTLSAKHLRTSMAVPPNGRPVRKPDLSSK